MPIHLDRTTLLSLNVFSSPPIFSHPTVAISSSLSLCPPMDVSNASQTQTPSYTLYISPPYSDILAVGCRSGRRACIRLVPIFRLCIRSRAVITLISTIPLLSMIVAKSNGGIDGKGGGMKGGCKDSGGGDIGRSTFTAAAASPFGFNSAPAFWGVCAEVAVGATIYQNLDACGEEGRD